MTTIAKITRKGQVTIPRKIREKLNSEVVEFDVMEDNNIVLRPVKSVAGSLSSYAKRGAGSFREIRERAWEKVVGERYGKKADRRQCHTSLPSE
jgi:AbrB family looped-hinge helix DNA binding protein